MTGINTHRYRFSTNVLIAAVDGFLILLSIFAGAYLRFLGNPYLFGDVQLILKMLLVVLVIDTVFYYFDLYDPRIYRDKKTTAILIMESLGASSILLVVIYYLLPVLIVGRGIFAISLFLIFLSTFSWRILFSWVARTRTFKEKILIIGTGELAQKIKKELLENGHDGFEIVGFIDENRDRIGQRI